MTTLSPAFFEVTLPGFDGSTDETDDRVLWVRSINEDLIHSAYPGMTVSRFLDSEVDTAMECLDFKLPEQFGEFKARIHTVLGAVILVSMPETNPNHPLIRCVDGRESNDPDAAWVGADDAACGPYRVFDVLGQNHVGPEFATFAQAQAHMNHMGGSFA